MIKNSLFAGQEREAKLDKLGDTLSTLQEHVDFGALAAEIDRAAPRPARERGGRPPFPTELMVRVLLVQQLFNLSDEQMEFQLLDRLSFQRFVGLRDSSQIPDRTTIWVFKERLIAANASETIFATVNQHLNKQGYIARGGQMIDASIVPVPRQHVMAEEKELIQEQAIPANWSPAKRRQKDTEAKWSKKHGKSYFGYKLSAGVDKRYKLIRRIVVSPASEHDTLHFEAVLDPNNTGRDVWADKGYVDQERETRLNDKGWRIQIQRKAQRNRPLSKCRQERNHRIAKTRARVEHVFASLEHQGGKVLRCIGIARATLQLNWKVACYNLRRLCALKKMGVMAF
jgi:transposase, IS5 family